MQFCILYFVLVFVIFCILQTFFDIGKLRVTFFCKVGIVPLKVSSQSSIGFWSLGC